MREPLVAYESLKAHQNRVEVASLAAEACRAYQEAVEAFSCLEEGEAFLEDSSWSTTRDKWMSCSVSAPVDSERAWVT